MLAISSPLQDYEGEELLNAAIEKNVLTQIENLRSYPIVHSKLYNGQLNIYAWVYKLETGGVFVYSAERCNIKAEHEEEHSDTEEALANPVPLNGKKSSVVL
jgi:carbonic anhydrase